MSINKISIQGAKTHNLANVSIHLPRNQLIVVTGPSGSGKSSLVIDVLNAEADRRYAEALPSWVRQFLSVREKPDVDAISGLSPAIAIQQKTVSHNPRSTVGTVTEIYDYLRILFARIGDAYCPEHKTPLAVQTVSQIADHILNLPENTRFLLLAPVLEKKKGEHTQLLEKLRLEGYSRIRLNGEVTALKDVTLSRNKHHTIEVVVARLVKQKGMRTHLVDALETTLKLGQGIAKIALLEESSQLEKEHIFSSVAACPECKYSAPILDHRLFSFNNAMGACPDCKGLGINIAGFDPEALPYLTDFFIFPRQQDNQYGDEKTKVCQSCQGDRLCLAARHVLVGNQSLPTLTKLPLNELQNFFTQLVLKGQRKTIAHDLLKEINNRTAFLLEVGLEYLTLSRAAETLSGGESQRIRLASQIGSGLVGVMYILDEPSIGLHARDNTRLLKILDHLRDLGNTVIVIEHDEEAMLHADYLVDIGPKAGIHGGRIVAEGTPEEVIANEKSLTGQYLSHKRQIEVPKKRIPVDTQRYLKLNNVSENNLKSVSVDIPLGLMICVTGVSGSGKSTLINQALYPIVNHHLNSSKHKTTLSEITGLEHIDKIIAIDQKPIGRTPRSNPATYVGLLNLIRDLFAATTEARARGYQPGRFSFNVKGGRCTACEGVGVVKVEMHFLADIHVTCDLCNGYRYNPETLEIKYKKKSIYDVLSMTVEEAEQFFSAVPAIKRKLKTLIDVGLNYITLGQSATTFSGGEAQRIKLAKELSKRDTGKTLYILDEPTTGLHFYDIEQLLQVLYALRDLGNTILIIEHNLDVIKTADWIIDLGPEGGHKGGEVIAVGTPETIAQNKRSYTGQYLKAMLERADRSND